MPYSPTNNTSINVLLSNDLSGTLLEPYVVSVEHIKQGILNVENGGTGLSTASNGSLLIGLPNNKIGYISGSNNDILIWSQQSGGWVNKTIDIVENISMSVEQNDIFEIFDVSILKDKKFNFSLLEKPPNLFLATPSTSSGKVYLRSIVSSDLPAYYKNILIEDSIFNGQFSGSLVRADTGSFNIIIGDGSRIENISSSNIIDFNDSVISLFSHTPHYFNSASIATASVDNLYVQNATYATGAFFGFFSGEGSELEKIQTSNIEYFKDTVLSYFSGGVGITFDSGTISSPNTIFDILPSDTNLNIAKVNQNIYINLSDDIVINNLSSSQIYTNGINASSLNLQNVSSSYINGSYITGSFFGSLYGSYSGSGELIRDIPRDALQFNYFLVNGNEVKLGENVNISGLSSLSSSNSNIVTSLSNTVGVIYLSDNPVYNIVNSNQLLANVVSSSNFIGDGKNLTNLTFENIGTASILNLSSDVVSTYDLFSQNASIINISSSFYYGDGSNIKNIKVSNISDIEILTPSFINSSNITTSLNQYSERSFNLRDNISLNSVTASFSGDGSKITNIQSNNRNFTGIGLQNGDIVYLQSLNTVSKASNLSNITSRVIGIINSVSGSNNIVQFDGVCTISGAFTTSDIGKTLFLGSSGDYIEYSDIGINCFAVQLGTLIDNNKLLLDIKRLWKVK